MEKWKGQKRKQSGPKKGTRGRVTGDRMWNQQSTRKRWRKMSQHWKGERGRSMPPTQMEIKHQGGSTAPGSGEENIDVDQQPPTWQRRMSRLAQRREMLRWIRGHWLNKMRSRWIYSHRLDEGRRQRVQSLKQTRVQSLKWMLICEGAS